MNSIPKTNPVRKKKLFLISLDQLFHISYEENIREKC